MLIYTCEQMRVIEENADVNGYSYIKMMENAGNGCAEKIHSVIMRTPNPQKSAVIICGKGKNGGDGFVIASNLCDKGYSVRIILACGEPEAYEAKLMYSALSDKPVVVTELSENYDSCVSCCMSSGAIVDCIYGIGFHGELPDELSAFFKDIAKSRARKFSVDIPSGLEGNVGDVTGNHFIADYTLAITCLKPVHIMKPAADSCGVVSLIDIGIDKEHYEAVSSDVVVSADFSEISRFFKPRRFDSNKGDYGRLISICGSYMMQGAAVMAANAAVSSGVGLVNCVIPDAAYVPIASKLTEPIMLPMKSDEKGFLSAVNLTYITELIKNATAILMGCGLGVNDNTRAIVKNVIKNASCPIILDADGINAICDNIDILKESSAPIVITPHPGEMSRLIGKSIEEIQADRIKAAKSFAVEYGCVVVLKGCNTVVASPSGSVYINRTGNPGMATAGSGDVLAGIISSFVCQSMSLQSAAIAGVYVHGLCGDAVMRKYSMHAVTPTRMIEELAEVLSNFE